MVELIGLLALSWLLIWLFERGNLSVLGLKPTKERIRYSVILFFLTAVCCSTGYFMRMYFGDEEFALNPNLNLFLIGNGLWLTFKSVLFEELLTRGVGLYLLIKKVGRKWAIFISALTFGLLHLSNLNAFSNIPEIVLTFFYPFLLGLVLAYAYAKTFSLYLPFAIHFGWNLIENYIFPGNSIVEPIFISVAQPLVNVSYFIFFMVIAFPKISAIISDYLVVKLIKNVADPVSLRGK